MQKPQLQNARRQGTRPKKRNNVLRRQRIADRKTTKKLRKVNDSNNPVRVTVDRRRTKSKPQIADTVSSMTIAEKHCEKSYK